MLRKFRVSNFKGFEDNFEFDLSQVNGYEFNEQCIKNGIANTAIVYGHNGVGKSNLALAIFDIIEHLTDKNQCIEMYENYLCANSNIEYATFYFEFLINSKTVVYEYKKKDYKTIVYEKFSIDGEELILLDRVNNRATVKLEGTETLKKDITNNEISILKYVKNNSELTNNDTNSTFLRFFRFVEKMLFFRSLQDRTYIGLQDGRRNIVKDIIDNGNVPDFEKFLNDAKIDCSLTVIEVIGEKTIAFEFNHRTIPLSDVISTGTNALTLFYFWYQTIRTGDVSFLFIDEFDAFYHQELSVIVIKKLIASGVQCVLTSHNLSNLTNDLLRPDCYFLMNKQNIRSLSSCTRKELREAHNIEKMYKAGAFDVE